MTKEELLHELDKKYDSLGEKTTTYLHGLLQAKPINYWDYIEVDTLLSLQRPRTDFKDESVFIMYHQVTELVLKMMIHELKQITGKPTPAEEVYVDKLSRLTRYTSMLMTSFDVMRNGMSYEDYNTFRSTLTPASGFQSAQFRYLELYCTPLINLINTEGRKHLPENPKTADYFEQIYWKDAGRDRKTGRKTMTLKLFEEKYRDSFMGLAEKMKGNTLAEKFKEIENPSTKLLKAMREFDYAYNVAWPKIHLGTAQHYLDKKGETKTATGGSEWKKYLHPKYQQRKFFPDLWSEKDIKNWGND